MFGQSAGSGDLLLGRSTSGFDGSVTQNGFGNNDSGTSSNPSNNPSGSSAFDLNDFPSLGGGGNGNPPGGSGGDSNSLAAALRQQQQLLVQQQQLLKPQINGVSSVSSGSNNSQNPSSNLYRLAMGTSIGTSLSTSTGGAKFSMATEDFPALPGAPPVSANGNSGVQGLLDGNSNVGEVAREMSGSSTPGSNFTSTGGSRSGNGGMFGGSGGDIDGMDPSALLGIGGLGNPGSTVSGGGNPSNRSMQQRLASSTSNLMSSSSLAGAGSTTPAGVSLSGDYGLLGLLGIIRMSDADRNALALGSDLTTLGLNLNSNDQLYSNFASPWSESLTTREPQYQLPMCYYMQPPALKTGHLSKFALETLFYIFYALPKDVLQAYAAQELYSRDWKYHVELKLWFKRAVPSDGVSTSGNTAQYIYFDINSWERRLFNGNMNQNITSGLLPEDDIRVKFPSS